MPRMCWRPELCPWPLWGSSRRSPRPPSRLVRGIPPPQELHPLGAFGASILEPSVLAARRFGVSFLAYITHLYFSNAPLGTRNSAANGLRPALCVSLCLCIVAKWYIQQQKCLNRYLFACFHRKSTFTLFGVWLLCNTCGHISYCFQDINA